MEPQRLDASELIGTIALTDTGERVGLVVDVYPQDGDQQPQWVWARTGIVATDVSVLPLTNARSGHGSLVLPLTTTQIEKAPRFPVGNGLSFSQEESLRNHYSVAASSIAGSAATAGAPTATSGAGEDVASGRHRALLSNADVNVNVNVNVDVNVDVNLNADGEQEPPSLVLPVSPNGPLTPPVHTPKLPIATAEPISTDAVPAIASPMLQGQLESGDARQPRPATAAGRIATVLTKTARMLRRRAG